MADAETARLCVQIIHSQLGPLSASVASVLLTRGRLSLPQIVRFTSLKTRIVRSCILVMVQHNVLWHAHSEDDPEMLEVNVEECLMRLRLGRYVSQAHELFGRQAGEIVELILDHGKLRSPDIIKRLALDPKAEIKYKKVLHELVSASYLKPSTILSHVSPRDKRIRYEGEEKAKIIGFPTGKQLLEAKETAHARLRREEEEAEKVGLKRKAKEVPNPRSQKQRKVVVEEDEVDDTVYFRANFVRFNIHIRNTIVETAVRERYNDCAAIVMRATLKSTEAKQMNMNDPRTDPTSIPNIAMQLSDDDDLSSGIVLPSSKKVSNVTLLKDYLGVLASADNPTAEGKASSFVSMTSSKVQVEFEIISRRLRRRVLEAVTRERHGDDGVRILRLLLDVGKMDEKQIAKVAMMSSKEVRPLLSALSTDSLISIQEVPKSADRNPTRTFYLWHVDLHKAYSVLLGNLYKTLYNISVRRKGEEEDPSVKAVLEKKERSDVSMDESLLSRMEKEILQEWEDKREKLSVLEMRVEEAVFILRDLGIFGINDD